MVVFNVSVVGTWQVYTIYTSFSPPITISATSILAIYNSAMVVSNVRVGSNWQVYTIYTSPSSPITISATSTLAIYNSAMTVSSVSVGSHWQVYTIYTSSYSPITISATSTLAIYNSTMAVSSMIVVDSCSVYTIYTSPSSPITISANSTLAIYNSTMVVFNVSVGTWQVYTIRTSPSSPITISANSTLAIYNSAMVVSNGSVVGTWQFCTMSTSSPSPVTISTNSTLAIYNNNMVLSNVSVGTTLRRAILGLSRGSFFVDSSTVTISDNHLDMAHVLSGILEIYTLLVEYAALNLITTSTLAIVNSTATVLNVTARVGKWQWCTVSILNSTTAIEDLSSLSIDNISITVSNMTMPGKWSLHVLSDVYSPLSIRNGSTLSISRNTIGLRDMMLGGDGLVALVHINASLVIVDVESRFTISENINMTMSNVTLLSESGNWEFYTFSVESSPVNIGGSSKVLITNNHMVVETYPLSSPAATTLSVVVASYTQASTILEATGGGLVDISGNTINTEGATSLTAYGGEVVLSLLAIVRVGDGATVVGNSTIQHNSVFTRMLGSTATIGTLLNFTTMGIDNRTVLYLCSNYVNAMPCKLTTATNQYSCMLVAMGNAFTGRLHECTSTSTPTPFIPFNTVPISSPQTTAYTVSQTAFSTVPISPPQTTAYTVSQTAFSTVPISPPQTTAYTVSQTAYAVSTTHPPTLSEPVCQSSPQPCPYASEVGYVNASSKCSPSKGLSTTIPHSLWGGGSPFNVSVLLHESLISHFNSYIVIPSTPPVVSTSEGVTQLNTHLSQRSDRTLWAVSALRYTGSFTRSAISLAISIQLPTDSFNCVFAESHPKVVVSVTLSEAKSAISDAVTVTTDVAKAVGAVSVVPSSLVRAGISSAVMKMLKCSEFQPDEEVGFVNNPFNWAAGREELQYHRGSVLTALITAGIVFVCVVCVLVSTRLCGESVTTWGAALDVLRLPSLPLVFIVLLSEVAVSSATSMLLYSGGNSGADAVLALLVLVPLSGYMGVYLHRTLVCSRYVSVEPTDVDNKGGADAPDTTDDGRKRGSAIGRIVQYAMEPTHDLVLKDTTTENEEEDTKQHGACVAWLRRNYYFVADRRWSPYGAAEVIGGTLINMLEGIPLTTVSRALCIARPVCVMLITAVLLVLLVWKIPNAVRLQHWCSLFVLGGMVVTSGLASANAVSPSEGLEVAAGYISSVVIGFSMVLGIVDVIVLTMTYIPALRSLLSFRVGGLQSTITHSAKVHDVQYAAALQVPMLVIPPPPPPPVVDDNDSDAISDRDEVGSEVPVDKNNDNILDNTTEVNRRKSDHVINGDEDYDDEAHVPPVYTPSVTSKGEVNLCNAPHRLNKLREAQIQRDILAEMDALDEALRNNSKNQRR
jgi:hypothetical protein